MFETDPSLSAPEPINIEHERKQLMDLLIEASDTMHEILRKDSTSLNRRLAALTADMTSLASGMFQGRITTGQPRLFRDYIEFLDLSAPMERSSPDVANLDLRLRLAMDRATKMGMTAENQVLDFDRSSWRQRSEKQK